MNQKILIYLWNLVLILALPLLSASICPDSNEIDFEIIPCEAITAPGINCSINATMTYLQNESINFTIQLTEKFAINNTCNFTFDKNLIGDYFIETRDLNNETVRSIVTVNDFNNKWLWFYGIMIIFAIGLFILGFNKESYLITILSGFVILAFALTFTTKGYPTITDEFNRMTIILISWGLGAYVTIYSAIKFLEENL